MINGPVRATASSAPSVPRATAGPRVTLGARIAATAVACVVTACAPGSCLPAPGGYYGETERDRPTTAFQATSLGEPEYLDPGLSSDANASSLMYDLFEGLVVKHPEDLRPTQGVATHWDQTEDNRVFRFHLRSDARWSDGEPVTAKDFAYAWTRILTPETGARMVTMLYPIKNGELFHLDTLKTLREPHKLSSAPSADDGDLLDKGTALRILHTARSTSPFEPLAATDGIANIDFTAASAKTDTAASMILHADDDETTKPQPRDSDLTVLSRGGKTRCNHADDHWYRVAAGDRQGWLPGCAIAKHPEATHALVAVHHALPTFTATRAPQLPDQLGFVPLAAMARDTSVLGIRTPDDHTLEVELEEPTPYFIELCGFPTYFPVRQDVIEKFAALGKPDNWFRAGNIVSNGPYVIDTWQFRYEITYQRNPYHYDHDKLKIHTMKWIQIPEYTQLLNLYQTGELDWIGPETTLPSQFMKLLPKYKDFDRSLYIATYWYEFNVEKPPVDDARVRRALNVAVDKQLLIDKITQGDQMPAWSYVPPYTGSGYAKQHAADLAGGNSPFTGPEFQFNPELGRKLLTEAGYKLVKQGDEWQAQGFPSLEILYNTSEGHKQIAVAIQAMWREHLGITVALRNEEWKVMLKNLRDGRFQIARFGWIADYNHPHTYADLLLSKSHHNWTHWKNPEYDQLVAKAAATADQKESIQLYRQAELMSLAELPRLPLYFYTKSTLIKPYVKGYWPNASNDHFIRWLWIDDDWRNNPDNAPSYPPREVPEPGRIGP